MVQRKTLSSSAAEEMDPKTEGCCFAGSVVVEKKKLRRFWVRPILDRRKQKGDFFLVGLLSPTPNNERVRGVLYANPLSEMCATVQC